MHVYNNIQIPGYTFAYPVRDQTKPHTQVLVTALVVRLMAIMRGFKCHSGTVFFSGR